MPEPVTAPKVLISYSHDSPEHMARVLALSDRLRAEGIDSQLDQYETSPPEGLERLLGAVRDNYRPDASGAMTELVEQNANLIQVIKTLTEGGRKLKESGGGGENREKLEALRDALTEFSGYVQDTLYNGSQPALQKIDGDLTGQDLAEFYEALDLLAQTSNEQATKLSQVASKFVLDPGYAALAKAIRQRAELFKRMPRFKGKITGEQAAKISEAVALWKQLNGQLEEAVKQLNAFILELK